VFQSRDSQKATLTASSCSHSQRKPQAPHAHKAVGEDYILSDTEVTDNRADNTHTQEGAHSYTGNRKTSDEVGTPSNNLQPQQTPHDLYLGSYQLKVNNKKNREYYNE